MPEAPTPGIGDIVVRGARTHNLRGLDLTLPARQLIVVTGVSGSGKSSLAFDTIYAEGQRRYVESLSAYARQFLERMEKPDVDAIEGISPAIAIRQKNSIRNPRSTVGTTTEIHDYLRLLFARVGRTVCRQCGKDVIRETAEVVAVAAGGPAGRHAAAGRVRDAGDDRRRLRPHRGHRVHGRGRRRRGRPGRPVVRQGAGQREGREGRRPPRAIRSRRPWTRCDARASAACCWTAAPSAWTRWRPRRWRAARRWKWWWTAFASMPRASRGSRTPSRPPTRKGAARRSPSNCPRRGGRRAGPAPVQRAFRVPHLRHPLRTAAAAAVLVQQPVRGVPDLPRVRRTPSSSTSTSSCPTRTSRSRRTRSSRGRSRTTRRASPT